MRIFKSLAVLTVLGSLAASSAMAAAQIGDVVADLHFKDIRYLERTLGELGEHKGYALVFLNSDCPIAQRFAPRLKELDAKFSGQGIQFVGVYCSPGETIMEMASHALENGFKFPVVRDEDHSVCQELGVERVPQVALLDAQRKLVYRGRINDQYRTGGAQPTASREDLEVAIGELLAGKPISVAETPVDGCRITPPRAATTTLPVTFHEQIAGIMQRHCQGCHHAGTPAPFALMTYEDVADHAEMVAEVVADHRMPPWYASAKYGHFTNDPGMTSDERDLVLAWVKAGTPAGDPAKSPQPLVFEESKWRIGEPDLVVTMKDTHDVQAEGFVPYQYVFLPYLFKEDTYVQAIEILPHNRNVVHHCNMAYANLAAGKAGAETFITGYVPGGMPMDLRSDDPTAPQVAYKILKGSALVLQIHYTTTGKPEKSQISVGFRFAKERVDKTTKFFVLDPRGWSITPGDGMFEIAESREIKDDATLLGLFSHMHVRGRDMTFKAHYPDGKTETLLQIPNYNFEWQLGYVCHDKIPAGTKIEAIAHFDNSKFNPYNPDPARAVPYGDQTYDEMFNGFVFWINDNENLNLKIDPKTGTALKEQVTKKVAQD
ncbi:MAG: redoxin family protein [Pirellulales bacterium]|nr:redoxin family protein [Pirellulales bacterium]